MPRSKAATRQQLHAFGRRGQLPGSEHDAPDPNVYAEDYVGWLIFRGFQAVHRIFGESKATVCDMLGNTYVVA